MVLDSESKKNRRLIQYLFLKLIFFVNFFDVVTHISTGFSTRTNPIYEKSNYEYSSPKNNFKKMFFFRTNIYFQLRFQKNKQKIARVYQDILTWSHKNSSVFMIDPKRIFKKKMIFVSDILGSISMQKIAFFSTKKWFLLQKNRFFARKNRFSSKIALIDPPLRKNFALKDPP